MLNPPTLNTLHALKLPAMAAAWTAQPQDAQVTGLSFDERFALLVDAEWLARENRVLSASLHDFR
jgi:IstB-like ATP binding protein